MSSEPFTEVPLDNSTPTCESRDFYVGRLKPLNGVAPSRVARELMGNVLGSALSRMQRRFSTQHGNGAALCRETPSGHQPGVAARVETLTRPDPWTPYVTG